MSEIVHLERNDYWKLLIKIKTEYTNLVNLSGGQFDVMYFTEFIKNECGIKVHLAEGAQHYMGTYTITDEEKYFMCILKYGIK